MNKISKFLCCSVATLLLTGCNILNSVTNSSDSYEQYFTDELHFKKFTDVSELNKEIYDKAYFWDEASETEKYTCYYTAKRNFIYVYKNEKKILCSFQNGGSLTVQEKDGAFKASTDEFVVMDEEGNKSEGNPDNYKNIQMAKYDDGWLFYMFEKNLIFISKDYMAFYVCEDNTKTFVGKDGNTKIIPDSDLLTSALEKLGKEKRVELPAPSTGQYEIWGGLSYYKEKPSHYDAYIAGVSPQEYVEVLKKNGFTVNRSYEDDFYTFYGTNGGYWTAYDSKMEIKIILKYQDYLYTSPLGKTYGPTKNTVIWFYHILDASPKACTKSTATDWSDYDKTAMAKWYDGSVDATLVPFPQISEGYMVPSIMSYAHEGLMDGTLKLHSECYNITDLSPVYMLDGYDQKLEAAGFHKYVPSYDLTTNEGRQVFKKDENCKYVECFINEEADLAVKYYFDINNGNTVRVFKKSEMKSWLQDEK